MSNLTLKSNAMKAIDNRNKVVTILDLLMQHLLQSKKATSTRMLALKCVIEPDAGWHTCRKALERIEECISVKELKVKYIFEMTTKYPALAQTEILQQRFLREAKAKVRGISYPLVSELADQYMVEPKSGG